MSRHVSSLVVYWLGFSTFTTVARVRSLVCELRFHIQPLHTKANKTKQNKKNHSHKKIEQSRGKA